MDLNEKEFQSQVLALAQMHSWRTAHFSTTVKMVKRAGGYAYIPDKGAAGFPDLVLVRGPRLVFAELKTDKTKTSDDQDAWLSELRDVEAYGIFRGLDNVQVHLWRPRDWETIVEVLK